MARKTDKKAAAMYALYLKGYSLAHVAAAFGGTRQNVYQLFRARGWSCRKHRRQPNAWDVWEAAHGPIPRGFILEYVDGDSTNTDINNLRCVRRKAGA